MNAVRHGVPLVLLLACVATGAFFAGRGSLDRRTRPGRAGSFAAGYASGQEDAFSGFDGGWAFGAPYIVTLGRGGPGITYRFARRWPMARGVEYRVCGRGICTRKAR